MKKIYCDHTNIFNKVYALNVDIYKLGYNASINESGDFIDPWDCLGLFRIIFFKNFLSFDSINFDIKLRTKIDKRNELSPHFNEYYILANWPFCKHYICWVKTQSPLSLKSFQRFGSLEKKNAKWKNCTDAAKRI